MRSALVPLLFCLVACRTAPREEPNPVGPAATVGAVSATTPAGSTDPLPPEGAAAGVASALGEAPVPAPEVLESGRGLWIWDFEKNAPPPERAAALAAKWGVRRVFIKSGNGAEKSRWARNFQPKNLAPFLARGIEVWGFGYFYPGNEPDADGRRWGTLEAQVEATVKITAQPGVTGLVVDAEIEFENRRVEATKLCALLRSQLGTRRLAYTSFGWLAPHPQFPFEELDAGCGDAFLPQVYWAFGWPGGVRDSIARMNRDIAKRGLKAPVWPIQSNERDPSVADQNAFFDLAGPNASIFYLHPEDSPQTQKLGAIHFRGAPSRRGAEGKAP